MRRIVEVYVVLLDVREDNALNLDSIVECFPGDMWSLIVVDNWAEICSTAAFQGE